MKKLLITLICTLLSAFILTGCSSTNTATHPSESASVMPSVSADSTSAQTESDLKIDADSLYNEYETAAAAKYNGKTIIVTGEVTQFGTDIINGNPFIVISSGNTYGIKCYFEDKSAIETVEHGDSIGIKGVIGDDESGSLQMSSCSVVSSSIESQNSNNPTTSNVTADEAQSKVDEWLGKNRFPFNTNLMQKEDATLDGINYYCFDLYESSSDKDSILTIIYVDKDTKDLYSYDIFGNGNCEPLDDWYNENYGGTGSTPIPETKSITLDQIKLTLGKNCVFVGSEILKSGNFKGTAKFYIQAVCPYCHTALDDTIEHSSIALREMMKGWGLMTLPLNDTVKCPVCRAEYTYYIEAERTE